MRARVLWAGAGALAGSLTLALAALDVEAGPSAAVSGSGKADTALSQTCPTKGTSQATVGSVRDGDTLMLADSRQLRLVGIQAPKLALGRAGLKDWPLADKAKAALSDLVGQGPINLVAATQPLDRNGRHLAQAFTVDGRWIQGEMVRRGFARVYTWEDNRDCGAALLKLEEAARAAKAGIWSDPFYNVRSATLPEGDIESFQIVEGVVVSTASVRGRMYLNFGADYRSDFTVTIMPDDAARFSDAGLDLLALKGQTIRVRGWIKSRNGPEIRATHPEQIERVTAVSAAKP